MKKPEMAKRLARQVGVSNAEAADQLDHVVHQILKKLRKGQSAPFPGSGGSLSAQRGCSLKRKNGVAAEENNRQSSAQLARVIRQCLAEGATVDIDGLGTFVPDSKSFRFIPRNRPQVLSAYVKDSAAAERVFEALEASGFEPWLDRRRLLPGQERTGRDRSTRPLKRRIFL